MTSLASGEDRAALCALLLGATLSALGCGQVERSQTSSTRAGPPPTGSIVVLRTDSPIAEGPDAPPRVTLARRQHDGTLVPLRGQYLHAVEFRDGVAAVTLGRELQLLRANGSQSLVAKELDGLPALDREGSLVYAARFGEVVELHRLHGSGAQQRLASVRGSATRLSPRSEGTVVFIGSERGRVAGIWIADSQGARCLTNCDLRVGRPWGEAYRPLPGETDAVRFVGSRIEWKTAEGRSESAPAPPTPSLPTRVTP